MSADKKLLLSFAIPTYNFASFLPATVNSIYAGLPDAIASRLEVIIVDGASTDNTADIAASLSQKYPSINYIRMPKRGGIDFDLDYAVSHCHAPFVWMLSADDILSPEWSQALLPHLQEHQPDIALIPAMLCALDMSVMRRNRIFAVAPDKGAQLYRLGDRISAQKYIAQALTLEALFSYMSAVLVKRETWLSLAKRTDYFGSCWAHCARLAPLLAVDQRTVKILYLNQFVLKKRSGNDSFMENGLIRRIGITVYGWRRIIEEFFDSTSYKAHLYRLMQRDTSIMLFLYAKFGASNKQQREEVVHLAEIVYKALGFNITSRLKLLLITLMPASPFFYQKTQALVPSIVVLKHKIKGLFH